MPQKTNGQFFDCFGSVTIVTDELIVYQGDIQHCGPRKPEHGIPVVGVAGEVDVDAETSSEFLNLALACTPVLLVPAGTTVYSAPLNDVYPILGFVRINVNQIIGVSDFNGVCAISGLVPTNS